MLFVGPLLVPYRTAVAGAFISCYTVNQEGPLRNTPQPFTVSTETQNMTFNLSLCHEPTDVTYKGSRWHFSRVLQKGTELVSNWFSWKLSNALLKLCSMSAIALLWGVILRDWFKMWEVAFLQSLVGAQVDVWFASFFLHKGADALVTCPLRSQGLFINVTDCIFTKPK